MLNGLKLCMGVLGATLLMSFVPGICRNDDLTENSEKPKREEIVLFNGNIFTMDSRNPWAQAIAIRKEKITRVGSNGEVLASAGHRARLIDLQGKTVIPGINDAHTHVGFVRLTEAFVDTGNFIPGPGPDAATVFAQVGLRAQQVPSGTWLTGFFGTTLLDDPGANRLALDAVSPNHPVYLRSWAGHGTLLNTAAMNAAGIAVDQPDPVGGFYGRFPGTQILDGFLHEYAEHHFTRYLKTLIPIEEARQHYRNFAQAAIRVGITSIQDMATGYTKAQSEQILAGIELPLRWRDICFPLDPDESCHSNLGGNPHQTWNGKLTSTGIKWITDGSPVEGFANTVEEYSDLPGWFGLFNFPTELEAIFEKSRQGNKVRNQLLFHAVGDQAIENILFGLDNDSANVWKRRRVRIEHGDLLNSDKYFLAQRHKVIIVQNPLHFTLVDTIPPRWGTERTARVQPMRSLLEAGIPLALGSDFIAGAINPFLDIYFAVTHPLNPAEAITVEEAVEAYTLGSAFAEFEEANKGMLKKGYLADLAVLSQDIFTVPVLAIPATVSVLTMVGGEIVYEDGNM